MKWAYLGNRLGDGDLYAGFLIERAIRNHICDGGSAAKDKFGCFTVANEN